MNADRFDLLENAIDKIHQTVVRIENDHNAKFEVIFDGLGAVNQRLDNVEAGQARLEQGQARLEQSQARMQVDVRAINQTLGLLRPIANDHESRIQALEN